ncbi:hypothetical protein ABPG75_005127 [Micractinium tetrahymenae]
MQALSLGAWAGLAAVLVAIRSLLQRLRSATQVAPPPRQSTCRDLSPQLSPAASHKSCTPPAPSTPATPGTPPCACESAGSEAGLATAQAAPAPALVPCQLPPLRQPGSRKSLGCPSVVATPRAVPASPFAALRTRLSMDSASSFAGSAPGGSRNTSAQLPSANLAAPAPALPSAFYLPSQQAQQQSLGSDRASLDSFGEPLEELLQHRALEDAELLAPFAGGSPGDASTAAPPPPLSADGLHAELRPWLAAPEEVQLLRRPGKEGEDWVLGEGASGRVVKALLRGQPVAAKQCALRSAEAQEAFVAEALCLLQLSHQNVVSLRGVCLDGPRSGTLLLEYCEGRDLHSVLRLRAAGSDERLFSWRRHGRRVARDVARALAYLHSQGVVHMDIKSSNCMLSGTGAAKLADLGLARRQTKPAFSQLPPVGTFEWAAPEVLAGGRNCTSAVDLYSFGVLLWEIVTGERPVRGALRMPRPDECPADIADLILACGEPDPAARPTAAEVLRRLRAAGRA